MYSPPRKPRPARGALARAASVPDGHVPDGHVPDGHVPDGHVPDGHVPDGHGRELSVREREVLDLLARDLAVKEIAPRLGITVGTARLHIAKILRVLNVNNRAAAVATMASAGGPSAGGSGPAGLKRLGAREREVLRLLATEQTPAEIARALGIAMSTLRNHLASIYQVLGVDGRARAVARLGEATAPPDDPIALPVAPPGTSSATPGAPVGRKSLSPREHEVLTRLAANAARPDIALAMGITEGTLRGLVSDVYRKLGVNSRRDAVATLRCPAGAPAPPPALARLGRREQAVLHLLSRGRSNQEIAVGLGITPGTVTCHLSNIYRILGVNSRAQAVAHGRAEGVGRLSIASPLAPA